MRSVGQPDLISGSTGTVSYVQVGTAAMQGRGFNSACHGAGRRTSRHQALKHWRGRSVVDQLAERDILIRRRASCRIAEEAPGVYKDVAAVVDASEKAGLARNVTRLAPEICLKG